MYRIRTNILSTLVQNVSEIFDNQIKVTTVTVTETVE